MNHLDLAAIQVAVDVGTALGRAPAICFLIAARTGLARDLLHRDLRAARRLPDRLGALLDILVDHDLFDDPRLLLDHSLLVALPHFERALADCPNVGLGGWPVDRAPLDPDGLVAEGDLLLDRPFLHARGDPDAAAFDLTRADVDLFFDDRHAYLTALLEVGTTGAGRR